MGGQIELRATEHREWVGDGILKYEGVFTSEYKIPDYHRLRFMFLFCLFGEAVNLSLSS